MPFAGERHGRQSEMPSFVAVSSAEVAAPVNVSFQASELPVSVAPKAARLLAAPEREAVKPNDSPAPCAPPASVSTAIAITPSLRTVLR